MGERNRAMKITETIERDCCQEQDLKPYHGDKTKSFLVPTHYCIHCGQLWTIGPQYYYNGEPNGKQKRKC